MGRNLKFLKVELQKTPNWKDGVLKDSVPKDTGKTLCIITLIDEYGNIYQWIPEKWEVNLALASARYMILADTTNSQLIKNPEPRPDIIDLQTLIEMTASRKIVEVKVNPNKKERA